MHQIYQLLLLAAIVASTALCSCNRVTYVFQSKTSTYPGDAAETTRTRSAAAVAPAALAKSLAVAGPVVMLPAAPSSPKDGRILEEPAKPRKQVRALLPQRWATKAVVARAVKMLQPQRRNSAEQSHSAAKTKTTWQWSAGILMVMGLIVFVAAVAANPTLEVGLLLVTVALVCFLVGAALLIASFFQKK
jgi:amino acid transporter